MLDMQRRYLLIVVLLTVTLDEFHALSDIIDGLKVYHVGEGEPVFVMPYPHASGKVTMAESELTNILLGLGKSVLTFDPPGVFGSTRVPIVDIDEMIACTLQTLEHFQIQNAIDVVGHSMASFCSLAFCLEHGNYTKKLVLIGSTSGWPAIRKWGIQSNVDWKEYCQLMFLGFKMFVGLGNLKVHKQLDQIINGASYVNKSLVPKTVIQNGDSKMPLPVRARWPMYIRSSNIDYRNRLHEIEVPVLICVGRHDPQTPVVMNEQLHDGIKDSRLVIFESSGHFIFEEEPDRFSSVLGEFLASK